MKMTYKTVFEFLSEYEMNRISIMQELRYLMMRRMMNLTYIPPYKSRA